MYRAAESIKAELKKSKKLENGRGKWKKRKIFSIFMIIVHQNVVARKNK